MKRSWIYACCLLVLLLAARPAAAADAGTITGVVRNGDGKPLGGARVTLNGGRNATARDMSTSATGQFHFEGLAAGDYVLVAELPGFTSRASTMVHLESSTSTASAELILLRATASNPSRSTGPAELSSR